MSTYNSRQIIVNRTMPAIVLLIALLATGYTKASETCGRKLDIVLIADGSTTVCNGAQTCPQWTATLDFFRNVAKSFKIGPDDTKIAFILMSDEFHVRWNLTGHTNETTLLPAIDNVAYAGGRLTKLGLLSSIRLLTKIFNPLGLLPQYGDRRDALNVAIFITDGEPDIGALLAEAFSTAYQQTRIAAFLVCVRPGCSEDWVRGIASPPQKVNETYFMVDSYFLLDQVKDGLVNKVCTFQLQLP